jgi:hypothetical protein
VIALANVLRRFKNTDGGEPYSLTAKYLYDPGLKPKWYSIRVAITQSKDKDSKEEENERKLVHQYDTAICWNVATVRGQREEP